MSIRSLSFEVRYPHAYELWDKAGAVGRSLFQNFDDVQIKGASPGQVSFTARPRRDLSVQLEKSFILGHFVRRDDDTFPAQAEVFEGICRSELGIRTYDRVATRIVYAKAFPSLEAASDAVVDLGWPRKLEGEHFGIEGKILQPHYIMRWEGEALTALIQFRAETVTAELTLGPEVDEEFASSRKLERHYVVFDVDFRTIGPVPTNQLKVSEWVHSALRQIRRDSVKILGQ